MEQGVLLAELTSVAAASRVDGAMWLPEARATLAARLQASVERGVGGGVCDVAAFVPAQLLVWLLEAGADDQVCWVHCGGRCKRCAPAALCFVDMSVCLSV
jgi:hypothetical protein